MAISEMETTTKRIPHFP